MNELITNSQRMTSLEIAELSGKNHKDVMRAIRNMEDAWEKINGRNFALVEYRDVKGELRPCYNLTKTECLYIATKFNDEARAKLVLRWEQLEKERIQQGAVRHLLVSDGDVMKEAEKIIGSLQGTPVSYVYWLHFAARPKDNRRKIGFILQ